MKLTIDLNDVDFGEYFEESDGNLQISEVFKTELVAELARQIRINTEIEHFVRGQIGSEITDAILKYKDDAILKTMVENIVSKRIDHHSLFFFGEETKRKTQTMIEETMDSFVNECTKKVVIAQKEAIKEACKRALENSILSPYIDYNRLAEGVEKYLVGNAPVSNSVSMKDESNNA